MGTTTEASENCTYDMDSGQIANTTISTAPMAQTWHSHPICPCCDESHFAEICPRVKRVKFHYQQYTWTGSSTSED